jgi:hypothetical protein
MPESLKTELWRWAFNLHHESQRQESLDRVYEIQLTDAEGMVCAVVEKTIYIRRKQPDSPG